jgi:hypothetical protein
MQIRTLPSGDGRVETVLEDSHDRVVLWEGDREDFDKIRSIEEMINRHCRRLQLTPPPE